MVYTEDLKSSESNLMWVRLPPWAPVDGRLKKVDKKKETLYYMNKEFRISIRLIALWLVFAISLYFIFTSVAGFTMATFKAFNGGYETYYGNNAGYGGGYCVQPPVYPQASAYATPEEKATWERYNQEYQKYNEEVAAKCQEEAAEQEMTQHNQAMASAMSDIGSSLIAAMFAMVVAVMTHMAIRRSEESK